MKQVKSNVINFGCRLNIHEGEVIKSLLSQYNLSNFIVINSCAVTQEAEKKLNYEIRKTKRNFPNKKIIITGCAAQINPKKYSNIKEVDYVIGNAEKLDSKTWSSFNKLNSVHVNDIFLSKNTNSHLINKFEGKSRGYIEIQQGCDHRCTFCIIPFGRGHNRSVPLDTIVSQINLLVQNGYNEVVLTGVDITDYGKDLPGTPNLFQLVKRILNLVPRLKQLRLSSIDCAEINDDFWPLLEEKRLMPHFHLSLQSGNDLILKRMKRRHSRKQAIDFCKNVRKIRKDIVFGADLIAGFPTETEGMFSESLDLIDKCGLTHLHIFPYSQRESTPAALMPQVPIKIIKNRAKQLRNYGQKCLASYLKNQIGKNAKVLIEQSDEFGSMGKTQHYTKIHINKKLTEGHITDCRIHGIKNNVLQAEHIQN